MSDFNTLIWQAEIFFSMSTKVVDPALAATLQRTAEGYLARATEARQRYSDGFDAVGLAARTT
jgi:hypothetical protein